MLFYLICSCRCKRLVLMINRARRVFYTTNTTSHTSHWDKRFARHSRQSLPRLVGREFLFQRRMERKRKVRDKHERHMRVSRVLFSFYQFLSNILINSSAKLTHIRGQRARQCGIWTMYAHYCHNCMIGKIDVW